MGRLVKCAHCGQLIDKDIAIRYKEKNYHNSCYEETYERDQLSNYICWLFNLKKPGPRNYALLKKYLDQGYTYRGIFYSLKYFYEINKNSITKSNESIGIVPYIYEEAQEYFKRISKKQEEVKEAAEKFQKQEKITVTIAAIPKQKKGYDLDSLLGE